MENLQKTPFYDKHLASGAKIVEFAGWQMPIQYKNGIVGEHLATRKGAGLFDVSHMGRFIFRGPCLDFFQHVLTNNAAALEVGQSQYTIIPNENGGAIDDAYLYRFKEDEYMLVVNASNCQKDWDHFQEILPQFEGVQMTNRTDEIAMLSLQGPKSKEILSSLIEKGALPEPLRNRLATVTINSTEVQVARTGYTGEPICFELFTDASDSLAIWDLLTDAGAEPIGLGARDTLRLEAGLPLYGHELGLDPAGNEIPIFACPLARFAVSFSPLKGSFIGKDALSKQFAAFSRIKKQDYSLIDDLPQIIRPVAVSKGIARQGCVVLKDEKPVGFITSGTSVPFYDFEGEGLSSEMVEEKKMRSICLAIVDSRIQDEDHVDIEIRSKKRDAVIVPYHLRGEAPPYARPIMHDNLFKTAQPVQSGADLPAKALTLLNKTIENTTWRQYECINLIPSEQTISPATRLLSIMDPCGRYAEHKPVKAFSEAEVFYYQGTDFIGEVEQLLVEQLRIYLGCSEVEARLISGQMANTAVFSSIVDFINSADRKAEPRRISRVLNHHIIRGGHLSAQPMGALHDFVAHDPVTERAAVTNFPVLEDNPYKIDVEACKDIIAETSPELIILGKSVIIHKEPVAEIRAIVDELSLDCHIMYDMAHVLGLVGPYFQQPFQEGADIVTGSTHKTYFGTQRGVVAANYQRNDRHWPLWETICRRAFPGSVSNHHLGTLLGLLMASYEMNHFKDEYQQKTISNAKSFALALKDLGMDVAGDPDIDYTETHQVLLNIGYGKGPEIARRLEENNIVVNYQASPEEEGFTASGCLRMGVDEMTRFGMEKQHFQQLAQLIRDLVVDGKTIKDKVAEFRKQFTDMRYCFKSEEFTPLMEKLHKLV